MKRISIILLTVIYFASMGVATLQVHYCMGEYKGFRLAITSPSHCPNCGMKLQQYEKEGCCKDELKQVKLLIDQKAPENSLSISPPEIALLPVKERIFSSSIQQQSITFSTRSHAPPRKHDIPIFLFDQVFLI